MTQRPQSQSGFVRAGHKTKHRLIMATGGGQKSGKTRFALTMPAPIAIIAIEPGLDGVIEEFQDHKEIFVADYNAEVAAILRKVSAAAKAPATGSRVDKRHAENMEEARELLDRIMPDYLEALEEARSVVLDTGSELWRLIRVANLGKIEQVPGRYYGNANQEMTSYIRSAYSSDANVLFTHRLGDEYKDNKPTGNQKLKGFGEMEYEVQIVVEQWKDPKLPIPDRFYSRIADCRLDPVREGDEFQGEQNTFPFVAAAVFGNDPSEWQ